MLMWFHATGRGPGRGSDSWVSIKSGCVDGVIPGYHSWKVGIRLSDSVETGKPRTSASSTFTNRNVSFGFVLCVPRTSPK